MTFLSPQKEKSLDPLKIKAFLLAEKEGFEPVSYTHLVPRSWASTPCSTWAGSYLP